MKRLMTVCLTLLGGSCIAFAQGTVSFANYALPTAGMFVFYGERVGSQDITLGGSSTGPVATLSNYGAETQNGNDWTVALYGAPGRDASQQSLVPLGVSATLADGTINPVAGTWFSTEIATIAGSGDAGSFATVQVYAWYNAGGLIGSLPQAEADGVPFGMSAAANVQLGGPQENGPPIIPPTLPFAALGNVVVGANSSVSAVPEPSTFAMIAIGVMPQVIQMIRRRKE